MGVISVTLLSVACNIPALTSTRATRTPEWPTISTRTTPTPETEPPPPIASAKPRLSDVALPFEIVDRLLPGAYLPPADVTASLSTFRRSGALEYYASEFKGATRTGVDILLVLYRWKDSNESALHVQLAREETEDDGFEVEDLGAYYRDQGLLSEHAWLATDPGGRAVCFNQAEVMVLIAARFTAGQEVGEMSGILVILGAQQQDILKKAGYQ